jgi:hypothetical protein
MNVWMNRQESDRNPPKKTHKFNCQSQFTTFNYSIADHFEALIMFRLILLTAYLRKDTYKNK